MPVDTRAELVARIERAAAAGLMSAIDRDIRIANVRNAGGDAELDLIGRDLNRLMPPAAVEPGVPGDGGRPPTGPAVGGAGAAHVVPTGFRAAALLATIVVIAMMITWASRSMRAVMEIGGACATGGPYVPVQPCPDGSWMIGVAVPVLIVAALTGTVLAVTLRAPIPLLVMWAGLFGSLGWNFIDYGRQYDLNVGLLVCGVVFWLMALPAIVVLMLSGLVRARLRPAGPSGGDALLRSWSWLAAYAVAGALGVWLGSAWWSRLA